MKEKLTNKFHQFLQDASEEESIVLEHLLDGLKEIELTNKASLMRYFK
ncbi:hypothetical protein [Bacillus dakarensis]|nr:hypothetical protein [Bacillus dakarensis]